MSEFVSTSYKSLMMTELQPDEQHKLKMLIAETLIIITEVETSEVMIEHHLLMSTVMNFSLLNDSLSLSSDSLSLLSDSLSNAVSVEQINTELLSQYESLRDVFKLTEQV